MRARQKQVRQKRRSFWINVGNEPSFRGRGASEMLVRAMSWRNLLRSNICSVTAASLGLALLCWAALDWAAYTGFVFSLLWS